MADTRPDVLSDDEEVMLEAVWPKKEMVQSSLPEPIPEEGKAKFKPVNRKLFQVIKQTSIEKLNEINILQGLENHPRTGVREMKKEVEIDDDVFAKTTKITTKEMRERATGIVKKKIEIKTFKKAEVRAGMLKMKYFHIWGGGRVDKKRVQGPPVKKPEIKLQADLIHWQTEKNERVEISSIEKQSVFTAEDIKQNREIKMIEEKKKTEEFVAMEQLKKEREKHEKENMPLVWNGMEWVFEDELMKKTKKRGGRYRR